jgi:hypothetical protein
MNKLILNLIFLMVFSNTVFSQTLPKDSPEIKQLIAMGYEIDKEEPDDTETIADNGASTIALSKNSERMYVYRTFKRERKLNSNQEFELYKLLNDINTEYSYQATLSKDSISFVLYDFGSYNPKTFSKIIRIIESVDAIWVKYPSLLKLINNDK